MNVVREQMEEMLEAFGTKNPTYKFLLDYGHGFDSSQPFPDREEFWDCIEKGACFKNTGYVSMLSQGRFIYFEGYAMSPACPYAVAHAWLYDPEQGCIYDPTWEKFSTIDGALYFGVGLKPLFFAENMMKDGNLIVVEPYEIINKSGEREWKLGMAQQITEQSLSPDQWHYNNKAED